MSQFSDHVSGILLFLLVMLGNALTIVLVRALGESGIAYSAFQLVFMANAIAAVLCLPLWMRNRSHDHHISPHWRLFSLRAALEFGAFSASFYAISQLPLPAHTALLFMTPIFGTIIALTVLREHGTWVTYGCVATGFVGMLIITRPGATALFAGGGAFFALLAAFGFACCGTVIKLLTRTQPPRRIAFYMLWMTSLIAAPFALAQWQPIAQAHVPYFIGLGLLAFFLQHAIGMALSKVPFMTVIPLNFVQLVLVSAFAYFLFAEAVSIYTVAGSIIILAATIYNGIHGARHAREMAAKEDLQAQKDKPEAA